MSQENIIYNNCKFSSKSGYHF